MTHENLSTIDVAVHIAIAMISLAFLLTFIRLVRGPTLPDRVVALDLMGVLAVGMIAAYAVAADQSVLLDSATVVGLVGFLGTIAFAQYVERRART